jgi:hypothetical protein
MGGGEGRRGRISTNILVALLLPFAWVEPASAHAPALATGIFSDASGGGTSRQWVRTNRGVILRGAPDASPRLLCNDAYSASLGELVPMIAAPDGLVAASYEAGILRIDSDGCTVEPTEAPLAGRHVSDLASSADGARYLALLTPKQELPGGVLLSSDAGRSWKEVGEIPAFGSALRSAPSDSNRVYVTAQVEVESGEATHRLFVSSDAGASFAPHPITLLDSEVRAFVLAVDPLDADRVLLRTLAGNPSEPERLLLSEDAGKSLFQAFSAVGPLVVAFDDQAVWMGGQAGLFRSDDRARTFQQVPSSLTHIGCLVSAGGSLTACGHQDHAYGVFTTGSEQGVFLPELSFSSVSSQVQCGDGADVAAICQTNFQDWLAENVSTASGGAAGASSAASADASSATPAPTTGVKPRSSCSLSPAGTATAMPIAVLFGISCWSRRRLRTSSRRGTRLT